VQTSSATQLCHCNPPRWHRSLTGVYTCLTLHYTITALSSIAPEFSYSKDDARPLAYRAASWTDEELFEYPDKSPPFRSKRYKLRHKWLIALAYLLLPCAINDTLHSGHLAIMTPTKQRPRNRRQTVPFRLRTRGMSIHCGIKQQKQTTLIKHVLAS